jgi:hypothetical protein
MVARKDSILVYLCNPPMFPMQSTSTTQNDHHTVRVLAVLGHSSAAAARGDVADLLRAR